jgi:hypothetical protein
MRRRRLNGVDQVVLSLPPELTTGELSAHFAEAGCQSSGAAACPHGGHWFSPIAMTEPGLARVSPLPNL